MPPPVIIAGKVFDNLPPILLGKLANFNPSLLFGKTPTVGPMPVGAAVLGRFALE
jgi:hypothetical protein